MRLPPRGRRGLDEAYRLHTRDVLRFVFTRAGDDLRAFSDAFRVRRDPER